MTAPAATTPPPFPLPDPNEPSTGGFWRAAARDTLAIPYCSACARFCWYPYPACPTCGSADLPWTEVDGNGTLYSWSVVRHAFLPAFADRTPFIAALVALDAAPHVRIATRIVETDPAELVVDAPVEVVFAPLRYSTTDAEVRAPLFRVRAATPGRKS